MSSAPFDLHQWLEAELLKNIESIPPYEPLIDASLDSLSGSKRRSWFSFAALIELLLWQDRTVEANQLTEAVIMEFASDTHADWPIIDEDTPFSDGLLTRWQEPDATDDFVSQADRLLRFVPESSELGKRLVWLRAQVDHRAMPIKRLLSGYENWDEPEQPLYPPYDELYSNLDHLKPADVIKLWSGAHQSRNIAVARELYGRFGLTSPLWYVASWYAGWQVRDGDITGAQRTLLDALDDWAPYAVWELTPIAIVLQDQLRPAATPNFRQEILGRLPQRLPWAKKQRGR